MHLLLSSNISLRLTFHRYLSIRRRFLLDSTLISICSIRQSEIMLLYLRSASYPIGLQGTTACIFQANMSTSKFKYIIIYFSYVLHDSLPGSVESNFLQDRRRQITEHSIESSIPACTDRSINILSPLPPKGANSSNVESVWVKLPLGASGGRFLFRSFALFALLLVSAV
jgi:hypothetical protein